MWCGATEGLLTVFAVYNCGSAAAKDEAQIAERLWRQPLRNRKRSCLLGARRAERSSIVFAIVRPKRPGMTEAELANSVDLAGQSKRAES